MHKWRLVPPLSETSTLMDATAEAEARSRAKATSSSRLRSLLDEERVGMKNL